MTIDRYQFLLLLTACLIITAPLEAFGSGVFFVGWAMVTAVLLLWKRHRDTTEQGVT